jgi:hypothetical protein
VQYQPDGYRCASGAVVIGQPDTSGPVWTVVVEQPGISPRSVVVIQAFA